jgi:hypothetical protein
VDGKTEVCIKCGKKSPKTDTDYTLISQRYGWRLSREKRAGVYEVQWYCPSCWATRKASASQPPSR